jgi:hypothetical protein
VHDVHAAILVTREGSRDCDYDGSFCIRELHGPLTVENAPLDLIDAIHGNVIITSTIELVNTSTQYDENGRTIYTPPPRELTCRNVDGDLTAWFTRANLRLEAIAGQINVKNEFGNTLLAVGRALEDKAHRVVSESGRIEVHLAPGSLGSLPLQALTNCGSVCTNAGQDILEDKSFTVGRDSVGADRQWNGVRSKRGSAAFDPAAFFADAERPAAVLQDLNRSAGLDLISRAGTVRVIYER